jgi:anti-sigma factor RsiW
MSDCRRTAERLTSYVDDALPAHDRHEVDSHLATCPACRLKAAGERGGRTVLRECALRLHREPLPPGLRTRCQALARECRPIHEGWLKRTRRLALVPATFTAIVIAIVSVGLVWVATEQSNTVLAAQLTADHMKCFRLFSAPEAPSADAVTVEETLADRFGWDVHVPPSSPADGITLIGARRCVYAEGSVPHIMYRVHGEDVSLYMLEGVNRSAADLVTLGHRSRIWTQGPTTYVLVSPASGDFTTAARYVMQQAH